MFDRLPPFVAPVAVTVVGGLAMVVALVTYLGGTADAPPPAEVAAATIPAATVGEPASSEAEEVVEAPALPAEVEAEPAPAAETARTDPEPAPEARDQAAAPEPEEPATPDAGEMELALEADTPVATPPALPDNEAAGAAVLDDRSTETTAAGDGVPTPLGGQTTETTAATDDTPTPSDGRATEMAAAGDDVPVDPDPGRTSSIPPARPGGDALAPEVEVAETDEEIAALEAIQRRQVEADVGPPSQEWTSSVETSPPVDTAPSRLVAATTTKWVNMRKGPADEAEVLMVVPALDEIQAETGCNWCAVTYDGKAGFIYKTFISYAEEEPAIDEAAASGGTAVE